MKKLHKSQIIFLIPALFTILFAACEKYNYEKVKVVIEKDVMFSSDIVPILSNKCNTCHNGSLKLDLRPDKAYNSLSKDACIDTTVAPTETKIYKKLTDAGSSHIGRANDTEIATILKWIELGAKNN
jgi:hypothetical protein